jgi:flagellar basal-body rod protein FlgF
MDRLIYTALSGMRGSMAHERVIASNMANSGTTGYRADQLQFSAVSLQGPQLEARSMTDGEVRGADMSAGVFNNTGRRLDIAMNDKAMLTLQAEDGGEAYSRRGDLSLSTSGVLQNGDGRPVLGIDGPISAPPGSILSIKADGRVIAADPATPDAPGQQIGRIKFASTGGSPLFKDLSGLFRVPDGGILPHDEAATATPGALEQSNVSATKVLAEMIDSQRLFEMRTKLVATAKEIDEGGASLMRLN